LSGAIPGVVIMNPKRVAADHGDIVGVAGMHNAIVMGCQSIGSRKRIDVWRPRPIVDLIERPVLRDDHQDMVVARQFTGERVDRRERADHEDAKNDVSHDTSFRRTAWQAEGNRFSVQRVSDAILSYARRSHTML